MKSNVASHSGRAQPPQRKIRWSRRIVYSLLPTLLIFASLELGLRLALPPLAAAGDDPLVGFSAQFPLFVETENAAGEPQMVTADNKLVWFNPQSFPKRKPAGTKRIVCVGGSTTYGRPYADLTSYSGWLRELLPRIDKRYQWEVINAGGVSYASYRVGNVMQELAQYEPDLFIVYSVHNEFLERRTYADWLEQPKLLLGLQARLQHWQTYQIMTRLVQRVRGSDRQADRDVLPAEVDERLNHTVGPADYHRDPPWREQVLAHYALNLRRMVGIARAAGADIIFMTPASNEADCSPFKSEHGHPLTAEELMRWESHLRDWQRDFGEGRVDQALRHIDAALVIDPLHAEANYHRGRTLRQADRTAEAKRAFQLAIDQDVCPLRAPSEISSLLREAADELKVPIVDFEQLLHAHNQRLLGHSLLGEELFLDHVHPRPEVHRQWALWIIDRLQAQGWVAGPRVTTPAVQTLVEQVQLRVDAAVDEQVQGVALRNLAKVLHWSGKFAEAAPRARDALEKLPGDPESRFVLANCLQNLGQTEAARQQFERLFEEADFGRGYLPFAELLVTQEDYEPAKAYLLLAVLRTPEDAYAYYLLGYVHLALGEHHFAVEALERSLQLYPGEPVTRALLEQARQAAAATTQQD